jgi:DNA-binding CsgD family transcriptional regulator/PAS domain-containing protein
MQLHQPRSTAVSSAVRVAWKARLRSLSSFAESAPLDEAALVRASVDLLGEFAKAPAIVYRPVRDGEGFRLAFWADRAVPPDLRTDFATLMARQPWDLFLYDPTRPLIHERNVARVIAPVENVERASITARMFASKNMDRVVQTRLLICSGPILLAWAGTLRDGPTTANDADAWLLGSMCRALRRPLRLLRRLPPAGGGPLFEAALEALAGEAYLVTRTGRVEWANQRGAAQLTGGHRTSTRDLASAMHAHAANEDTSNFEIHPVRDGSRDLYILHRTPSGDVARGTIDASTGSAFDAALAAIAAPAFLLDQSGRVLHANVAGFAVLDSRSREVRDALREAAASPDTRDRFHLTRVAASGVATHFLAIACETDATQALVDLASERWGLTPRQAIVLKWLTSGATNARIGAELAISDRTVESHVGAIMQQAQCHSRAMLVAEVLRRV